jgi:hypothetical protein
MNSFMDLPPYCLPTSASAAFVAATTCVLSACQIPVTSLARLRMTKTPPAPLVVAQRMLHSLTTVTVGMHVAVKGSRLGGLEKG